MFSRLPHTANSTSNPRKRLKRAHSSDSEDASLDNHSQPPSTMPLAPTPTHPLASSSTADEKQPCHHQQTLARLEPDLDSMRHLITCKICQRFLSEPYGLSCGHTYCYVCLDAWLVAQRKRTCPDCRSTIKQQPVPSFLIREMTRVFAYRAELLPDGETVEEHDEYIKEAVAKVTEDKEGAGLFRGLFSNADRLRWGALHDPGDDVDRCPNCHWELEEGRCGSCGLNIGDEDGFGLDTGDSESSDDDELDNEMVPHDYDDGMDDPGSFDEDDFMDEDGGHHYPHDDDEHDGLDLDAFGVLPRPAAALRRQRRHRRDPINLDSEPESEDSEDPDNDPQMEGFLDNDVIEELDSGSSQEQSDSEPEAEETPRNNRPRQFIRPMVIQDSDDDIPHQPRRPVVIESSDDEEEGPVARNSQRAGKVSRGTRRQQIHEISSSEEDTSDDDSEEPNRHNGNGAQGRAVAPGRRHRSIPVDSESGSNSEADSESDEAGGVNAGGFSPMQSEADDNSQADQFEGNYGAYGVYDNHVDHDSDGENLPPFYQQGNSDIDDDYDHDRAQQDMDILNAMNYADDNDDDDDDGGRSTTAGSAPFPSPFRTQ
ncbi:hypothetical protein Q7P35_011474 [Cladosporium inversicolor]